VTPALFREFPTAAAFAAVEQETLERWLKPTGFFRQKSRAVRACCQHSRTLRREVPRDFDDREPARRRSEDNNILRATPSTTGDRVDTHVGRLSQRLGFTTYRPRQDRADLVALCPPPTRFASSPAPVPRPAYLPGPEAGLSGLRTPGYLPVSGQDNR
jgi:endonuclease-3